MAFDRPDPLEVAQDTSPWFSWISPGEQQHGQPSAGLRSTEIPEGRHSSTDTDNACTYQFYEHRGFERMEEKEIILEMPKGQVPLKCFVYSKKL